VVAGIDVGRFDRAELRRDGELPADRIGERALGGEPQPEDVRAGEVDANLGGACGDRERVPRQAESGDRADGRGGGGRRRHGHGADQADEEE
jgi:hypothetical protein